MATRRNRKNGRFSKSSRRRTRKSKLSLTGTAQSLIIANAISKGAFRVPLTTFLGLNRNFPGGTNSSNEITLRELLDLAVGGDGNIYSGSFPEGFSQVMKSNLKANWVSMATAAVAVPVMFKVGTKLLRKPVIQPMNKLIKMSGLGSEVKV